MKDHGSYWTSYRRGDRFLGRVLVIIHVILVNTNWVSILHQMRYFTLND